MINFSVHNSLLFRYKIPFDHDIIIYYNFLFTNHGSLTDLNVSYNKFSELNLRNNINLKKLNIEGNYWRKPNPNSPEGK